MLRFCMFGGYEGPLTPDHRCYVTLFGACELKAPTLARRLIAVRHGETRQARNARQVFVTLFGSTEIKSPTLAEEFIDLKEAVRGGLLDLDRWEQYVAELETVQSRSFLTFTLFGALSETELPSEDEEVESLALQRHFGNIGEDSGRLLEMGVGQAGVNRRTVLHGALRVG